MREGPPAFSGGAALALGLSPIFRNDLQQLDTGMLLYDAFYRWCRDGMDETHHWPNPAKKGLM